jgi:hypothetical protein
VNDHMIADPPRPWSLTDAWTEGHAARERGELDDTNPFRAGPLRVAWFAGWDNHLLPGMVPPARHSVETVDPTVAREARAFVSHGRHHLIVSHHKAA